MTKQKLSAALAVLAMSAVFQGCNMFGGIDSASSREELLSEALALMDQGECVKAIDKLNSISNKDDATYQATGWANMCAAGATVQSVGKTLFSYKPTDQNFAIVGELANSLIPVDQSKLNHIQAAITAFGAQADSNDRAINMSLSYLINASAYIAKQAHGVRVQKDDIGANSCATDASNCALSIGSGNCDQVAGKMTDADAQAVSTQLIASANAAGARSELGVIKDLATQLGQQAAADKSARCVIYNKMLTE